MNSIFFEICTEYCLNAPHSYSTRHETPHALKVEQLACLAGHHAAAPPLHNPPPPGTSPPVQYNLMVRPVRVAGCRWDAGEWRQRPGDFATGGSPRRAGVCVCVACQHVQRHASRVRIQRVELPHLQKRSSSCVHRSAVLLLSRSVKTPVPRTAEHHMV